MTMEMFMFIMPVADAVWVALHICTMGTWGAKIPQNQKESQNKKERERDKEAKWWKNDWLNSKLITPVIFCLYFAIGNSKGWPSSGRNGVSLHCGDLTLLAPGNNRHPAHGELNPLEFCAQCLWARGAKLGSLISAMNLDMHESRVCLKGLLAYLHASLTLLTTPDLLSCLECTEGPL